MYSLRMLHWGPCHGLDSSLHIQADVGLFASLLPSVKQTLYLTLAKNIKEDFIHGYCDNGKNWTQFPSNGNI